MGALTRLLNTILESKMPEEWRRRILAPVFKNSGDMQSCCNYRGRVAETMLRGEM